MGALAATGNASKRAAAGVPLANVTAMPFAGFLGDDADTLAYLDQMLAGQGSGVNLPAAIIVETVQGEGGLDTAGVGWLRGLQQIYRRHSVLLIVDDIQTGCGRTGIFFSFEEAGLVPDMVCLSKSISGYGLPMALVLVLVLVKPEHDQFVAGEHNGTFRGNNLAFVTAAEALRFWDSGTLQEEVAHKAAKIRTALAGLARRHALLGGEVRGRGLLQGIAVLPLRAGCWSRLRAPPPRWSRSCRRSTSTTSPSRRGSAFWPRRWATPWRPAAIPDAASPDAGAAKVVCTRDGIRGGEREIRGPTFRSRAAQDHINAEGPHELVFSRIEELCGLRRKSTAGGILVLHIVQHDHIRRA